MQEQLQVKIKRVHPDAVIPTYAKAGDAGMDLTATERIDTENFISYKTGLCFAIPEGYMGLIFPRISVSNTGLSLANSVGVVDAGYRDEVELRFKISSQAKQYNAGDRVGQIIIMPFPKVEFLDIAELPQEGNRGGGYGSTGN